MQQSLVFVFPIASSAVLNRVPHRGQNLIRVFCIRFVLGNELRNCGFAGSNTKRIVTLL
jgi:hypothetical protein